MTTLTLHVPNISCGHCVRTIQNELTELDGVQNVNADQNSRNVTVVYDTPADEEQIRDLLKEINYPAE